MDDLYVKSPYDSRIPRKAQRRSFCSGSFRPLPHLRPQHSNQHLCKAAAALDARGAVLHLEPFGPRRSHFIASLSGILGSRRSCSILSLPLQKRLVLVIRARRLYHRLYHMAGIGPGPSRSLTTSVLDYKLSELCFAGTVGAICGALTRLIILGAGNAWRRQTPVNENP